MFYCDHIFRPFFAAIITMEIEGMHAALKSMPVYSYVEPYITLFLISLILVLSYYYLYAHIFSTRNPHHHEVVNHIRSGPAALVVVIMTKCASAEAIKNLLQLPSTTDLRLVMKKENWLAVADEIRHDRCNVQRLTLAMLQGARSDATEAVKAVASAIRQDQNLELLTLEVPGGFTDEAGVALAEALTVNKTLRMIKLSTGVHGRDMHNKATLGAQSYEAFTTMLRTNTTLNLELPPFETAGADERLRESRDQLRIEQRLNKAGRGKLLASSQTTKEEWVAALDVLNTTNNSDDSPALQISCMYSLLRLHPATCMS
jgi:hypothetical protein